MAAARARGWCVRDLDCVRGSQLESSGVATSSSGHPDTRVTSYMKRRLYTSWADEKDKNSGVCCKNLTVESVSDFCAIK